MSDEPAARRGGRLTRLAPIATALITAVMVLTGCVGTNTESQDPRQVTSSSSPTPPSQEDGTAPPSDDGEVTSVPEAKPDTQTAAAAVAGNVIATFGQPTLDASAWLEQMTPLLSPTGYDAYTGTDPAQIPVTEVTGPGRVLPASTDVALIVEVPTDAGAYNVTLTRGDASAPWLAERIRPAQG